MGLSCRLTYFKSPNNAKPFSLAAMLAITQPLLFLKSKVGSQPLTFIKKILRTDNHLIKIKTSNYILVDSLINKLINYLIKKPRTLFLIDSLGAILTGFILFVIMRQFNEYIGMPKIVLTYLSFMAICFCIYSAACFLFLKERWTPFVRLIGVANLLYCALTIGLLIKYCSLLTTIGIVYFLIEIVIIFLLTYVELNVATKIKKCD